MEKPMSNDRNDNNKSDGVKTPAYDIKLVATDLDGTLLNPEMQLSHENKAALEACAARGIHVVVATGRAVTAIPEAVREIEGVRYLVTSNGSKVFDGHTNAQLYAKYIGTEAIESVMDLIENRNILIEVFYDGTAYISRHVLSDLGSYGVPGYFQDYIRETRVPVEDVAAFVRAHIAEIENINFDYPDDGVRSWLLKKLGGSDLYTLTTSLPFNFEIGGIGVSKAEAIDFLCKKLGVKQEQTMCFGDNNNDVDMIEYAGVGIAMGDAVSAAKAAADYVTLDSGDSGVAFAIEQIILT
jgi:Cof subfamily protein (haloacid dehalogenase superfamily)